MRLFLECTNFRDDSLVYKYICCKINYQQKFDEQLQEQFFNTYKFSNPDNSRFISFLQKSVYPYEYIYIYIYTDANYANAVRVYKDFRNKTFWRISWIIYSKRYIKKKKKHYFLLMYLRTFEICVLKYMSFTLQNFS